MDFKTLDRIMDRAHEKRIEERMNKEGINMNKINVIKLKHLLIDLARTKVDDIEADSLVASAVVYLGQAIDRLDSLPQDKNFRIDDYMYEEPVRIGIKGFDDMAVEATEEKYDPNI